MLITHRPMHLQHACTPFCHLCHVIISRRTRTCLCRARRQPPVLVSRKAVLHTGNHLTPIDARGGRLLCRVERRWTMGPQRRRRRYSQSVGKVMGEEFTFDYHCRFVARVPVWLCWCMRLLLHEKLCGGAGTSKCGAFCRCRRWAMDHVNVANRRRLCELLVRSIYLPCR